MSNNTFSDLQKKILAIFLGVALPIIALEFMLRLLPVNEGLHQLSVSDSNKVMRFEENRDFTWSRGWNFSVVSRKHSNNYGFLNDYDYFKHETTPLVAIIGDSYVEAAQVQNSLAMHGLLAKVVANRGRVYSFGVSGMPMSTYLMYAEYAYQEFKPDSMVFIIVGNDFDESLLKYDRKRGGYHFVETDNGDLVLQRVDFESDLMKKLARQFALLRYLYLNLEIFDRDWLELISNSQRYVGNSSAEANSERVADSQKAVDEFFRQLPSYSGLAADDILFVVDGMRPHIYSNSELQKAQGSFVDIMCSYFINQAGEKGYEVIDMQPIFISQHKKEGTRFEFETDGHWNELGHKHAGEAIALSNVFAKTFNIEP